MKLKRSISISLTNCKQINKPNEDAYLCDDDRGIYILMDGVSRDKINGIYPNPSPSFEVSKIFIQAAYKYFIEHCDTECPEKLLYNMFNNGNKLIKDYNNKQRWENNFYPGTVGVITIIKEDIMYYAYIGDCGGSVINKQKQTFTRCQTELITKNKGQFSSIEIRNIICNNKEHPYSYGVLNGDIRALDFVEYGYIKLLPEDKVFLYSDGFVDVMNDLSAEVLYTISLKDAIKYSKGLDDKTLIIIEGK